MKLQTMTFIILVVLAVFALIWYVQSSNQTKICSVVGTEQVCQECTCPRGKAILGIGSVACPDGAQPVCSPIQ